MGASWVRVNITYAEDIELAGWQGLMVYTRLEALMKQEGGVLSDRHLRLGYLQRRMLGAPVEIVAQGVINLVREGILCWGEVRFKKHQGKAGSRAGWLFHDLCERGNGPTRAATNTAETMDASTLRRVDVGYGGYLMDSHACVPAGALSRPSDGTYEEEEEANVRPQCRDQQVGEDGLPGADRRSSPIYSRPASNSPAGASSAGGAVRSRGAHVAAHVGPTDRRRWEPNRLYQHLKGSKHYSSGFSIPGVDQAWFFDAWDKNSDDTIDAMLKLCEGRTNHLRYFRSLLNEKGVFERRKVGSTVGLKDLPGIGRLSHGDRRRVRHWTAAQRNDWSERVKRGEDPHMVFLDLEGA